jgi:hypothetical protein
MANLDPSDSDNYRCVSAKNGALFYYFGKKKIKKVDIPKKILPSLLCPQKKEALVAERTAALEKKAARLKKNLAKNEEKKAISRAKTAKKGKNKKLLVEELEEEEEQEFEGEVESESGNESEEDSETEEEPLAPRKSPNRRGVSFATKNKPKSPPGRSPRRKVLKKKCLQSPEYDFLLYAYNKLRYDPSQRQLTRQIIEDYESDHNLLYPFKDRADIITLSRSPKRSKSPPK